jgi:type II secretory pathway pseudopilin PulG
LDAKRPKFATAVTLVEVMVAMVILTIAALGALSYQYHTAGHVRIARAQSAATHVAQVLLEDWKSTGGSVKYNPGILAVGLSSPLSIPATWTNVKAVALAEPLNRSVYAVTIDDLPMLVMLSWEDVAYDATAGIKLRQLCVTVKFGVANQLDDIPPVTLTTYVRDDASGG